jgi:hypothetical protein
MTTNTKRQSYWSVLSVSSGGTLRTSLGRYLRSNDANSVLDHARKIGTSVSVPARDGETRRTVNVRTPLKAR